jgi:hypothetical protein
MERSGIAPHGESLHSMDRSHSLPHENDQSVSALWTEACPGYGRISLAADWRAGGWGFRYNPPIITLPAVWHLTDRERDGQLPLRPQQYP